MSILDVDFMRYAFAAGAIVGLLAPAVGFFLVQRGMSLIGDGIGHAAFAGVAAGYLFGVSPVATALAASVLAAVTIEWLRSRYGTAGDQATVGVAPHVARADLIDAETAGPVIRGLQGADEHRVGERGSVTPGRNGYRPLARR